MKIYLDIDGTLIHEEISLNFGKPAVGLADFLVALRPYETYWLTTHCMDGDPFQAQKVLKRALPEASHADIERIKPTIWHRHKSEALDWDSDFLWFENYLQPFDRERLKNARSSQRVIEINLPKNPTQLIDITRDLLMDPSLVK